MDADATALLALGIYGGIAIAVVLRQIRASAGSWQVYLLHVISRFFTPFVFRQRIQADCPLPAEGGALILANHRSPVDPMLIYSSSQLKHEGLRIRPVEFLTAVEYCDLGGPLGFITRHMDVIPVQRSGRDMGPVKEALRRIRAGRLVGVFPEGRINLDSGLLPGNPGVAWLALHSKAPVYPVFLHDAPQGNSMVDPFLTFCRAGATYGDAVDLSAYYGRRINQELLDEVTEILMTRLASLGGVEYAASAPDDPAADAENTGDRAQHRIAHAG